MPLKISIRENHLPASAAQSPFIVFSNSSDVVEFDRFVDIMAKGRTTLTKTDILAVMQLYREELQNQLSEGRTVKTPTGSFFLSASGSMESVDESFLPRDQENNHEVRLHHRPEKSFEDAVVAGLKVVRAEKPDLSSPKVTVVQSAGADPSAAIHAGGMIQVKGLRLRFDPKEASQGIFFIDGTGVETRSPFYPMILPATVLASVPASLGAGAYALAFRAAVNGKDVREHRFEGLTIAAT